MTSTTNLVDLGPATRTLARLVAAVPDDRLAGPTPCPAYTVADLCDHIGGLTVAFTAAARKQRLPGHGGPTADGSALEPGWRERIGDDLVELAAAWREPAAYEGTTMAGPVELPAPVAALVALDEVVVHAWDLARATGQELDPDATAVAACLGFMGQFEAPLQDGPFGPPVPVPSDAPAMDRLAGRTGRDPSWSPES